MRDDSRHETTPSPRTAEADPVELDPAELDDGEAPPGIAVIGMSGRLPGASDLETFWSNLRGGDESVRSFSRDELLAAHLPEEMVDHPDYVPAKAVLDDCAGFDASFFGFSPREATVMDPQQRVFLECCWEALESAGVDPAQPPGAVGVYAGVAMNSYLLRNLMANEELVNRLGIFQLRLLNDKDFLSTWVSYRLDLKGPSLVVQTACSTSLVAVHVACQALLAYECDAALAGGVAISQPQTAGHLWEEGGIFSRSGHCRPFDAKADGIVVGNGAGVVLLERLEDALANGHPIRAVIRGSAVNNDGSMKLGHTAPSAEAQAEVIAAAQSLAEVSPETVGYVETHGTGTALGDSVEVSALGQVFREATERRAFCALGSVKANLGHLDQAAGIAGLVKTVLAVERGTIPPLANFSRPNPALGLKESPFYVPCEARAWPSELTPRRAGVSSFGIGGTNAHAVVEEPPVRPPSDPGREHQLLVLSARTSGALEAAGKRLAACLENSPAVFNGGNIGGEEIETSAEPEVPSGWLADVAFTLQSGRRVFGHRRMLVASSAVEASAILRGEAPGGRTGRAAESAPGVAFLFPGQGTQHPGMGRELARAEPIYRDAVADVCARLEPHLGFDLRRLLDPPASERQAAQAELRRTALAQPALFVVGHALAELWRARGVEPHALLGHSVGEWVAATVAGVVSLDDALHLVVARGQLMDEMPVGAMLSLPLSAEEVEPLLAGSSGGSLALAAVNAPRLVVVSGPENEIDELARRLAERPDGPIEARRLHTSHAFHSAAMESATQSFREAVAGVELAAPRIPVASNHRGTWLDESTATDPAYWAAQMRHTVRFADGLETVLAGGARVFVELGPSNTLATFARQHPAWTHEHLALASLPTPTSEQPADAVALAALGQAWLAGVEVDWAALSSGERRRYVVLPTYPFERQHLWVEAPSPAVRPVAVDAGVAKPAGGTTDPAGIANPAGATDPAGPGRAPNAANGADAANRAGDPGALGLAPRPAFLDTYVAPEGETERGVAAIWETLLGVTPVGRHDGFHELGGHSLLLVQLAPQLEQRFAIRLPLRELANAQTVAELAGALERYREEGGTAEEDETLPELLEEPQASTEPFAPTSLQTLYHATRGSALGGLPSHLYSEVDYQNLDLDRLTAAWQRLIQRHGMLRAILDPQAPAARRVLQRVPETQPRYAIELVDLSGLDDAARQARLLERRRELAETPFATDRWPLFTVRATRLGASQDRLHLSFDLRIADAWSIHLLLDEMHLLYKHPETELRPLRLSFRDYRRSLEAVRGSATAQRAERFWRQRLRELPPPPALPRNSESSPLERPRLRHMRAELEAEDWERYKAHAAARGLSPTLAVLSTFAEVIDGCHGGHSHHGDRGEGPAWRIFSLLESRQPLDPEVNAILGDFTALVPLVVDRGSGSSLADRGRVLQDQLWEALDHRWADAAEILAESLGESRGKSPDESLGEEPALAATPVLFTGLLSGVDPKLGTARRQGLSVRAGREVYRAHQRPSTWLNHVADELRGRLVLSWHVVEGLFADGLIEEMFESYVKLIQRLAASDTAWEAADPWSDEASHEAASTAARSTASSPGAEPSTTAPLAQVPRNLTRHNLATHNVTPRTRRLPVQAPSLVLVVSFPKAGTHLIGELMKNLGYEVIGPVVPPEILQRLGSDPTSLPHGTCILRHRMPLDELDPAMVQSWHARGWPSILLTYRDPRDVISSYVHFLMRFTRGGDLEPTSAQLVHAAILETLPDHDARLLHAIRDTTFPAHGVFRESTWLLHHPQVCKVSFERLIGEAGGGSDAEQAAQVEEILTHLDLDMTPQEAAHGIYQPRQKVFRRGQIGSWRDEWQAQHLRAFNERFKDVLELYGYPLVEPLDAPVS